MKSNVNQATVATGAPLLRYGVKIVMTLVCHTIVTDGTSSVMVNLIDLTLKENLFFKSINWNPGSNVIVLFSYSQKPRVMCVKKNIKIWWLSEKSHCYFITLFKNV